MNGAAVLALIKQAIDSDRIVAACPADARVGTQSLARDGQCPVLSRSEFPGRPPRRRSRNLSGNGHLARKQIEVLISADKASDWATAIQASQVRSTTHSPKSKSRVRNAGCGERRSIHSAMFEPYDAPADRKPDPLFFRSTAHSRTTALNCCASARRWRQSVQE